MRKGGGLRRKLAESQGENECLQDFMSVIRHGNDDDANQVISMIRSNAPLCEIHQRLTQLTKEVAARGTGVPAEIEDSHAQAEVAISQWQEQSITPRTTPNASHPAISRGTLSVKRLTDHPVHQVTSSLWTSVTQDSHLVSHLLSLWATWEHLYPDGIVLELFLRDMRAQKLGLAFCSPFLVNCILAAGCLYSDYEEARMYQGQASDLSRHFVREAKSHLEEDSTLSIATTQGLMVLYLTVSKMDNSGSGRHFLEQAILMCEELMGSRQKILRTAKSEEEEHELSYAIDFTIWGVSWAITADSVWWRHRVLLPVFRRPYPIDSSAVLQLHKQKWFPYPQEAEEQESYYGVAMQHHGKLTLLERELLHILFSHCSEKDANAKVVQQEALADVNIRLVFWYERLPVHFKGTGSLLSPTVIQLR
ncbi:hypothetical protein OHC33_011264 [Knufia fluminis]|uniref:Transcription factor domain-containing protein n=1 Tax=Knufia fluminis TaxID=191047 RepID=A0AAN8E877_9EURO|nr:hypothetical protein OHC33_011264 [Knufia fluminis]